MSTAASVNSQPENFTKKDKMVTFGCLLLIFSLGLFGLSLATVQGPILKSINAESSFALLTTISSLAICIMTPVGGRMADIVGARKVILYAGVGSIITAILMPFLTNPTLFIIDRFLFSLGQGAMACFPFLIVRYVNPIKDLPKIMGYLTMAMALGSFLGSYLAGLFTDWNMLWLAMIFPVIFLIPGVALVYINFTKEEHASGVTMDWIGLILLTLSLGAIFISLNYGPAWGWGDWRVITGLVVGIIALIVLILVEKKTKSPLIPLSIFANKQYSMLLLIAFLSVFYMTGMNTYVPRGVQDLMGASNAASGTLQIPRTIVSVILPGFVGAWLAKNQKKNTWIAMTIAGLCIAVSFCLLIFMGPAMPIWFVTVMLTFTGVADTFRSVALTPAAQSMLAPQDMGIGTSMVGFVITLSNLISASLDGIAYDTLMNATPGLRGETDGVDTVFLIAAATGILCTILSCTVYRKMSLSGKYLYHADKTE